MLHKEAYFSFRSFTVFFFFLFFVVISFSTSLLYSFKGLWLIRVFMSLVEDCLVILYFKFLQWKGNVLCAQKCIKCWHQIRYDEQILFFNTLEPLWTHFGVENKSEERSIYIFTLPLLFRNHQPNDLHSEYFESQLSFPLDLLAVIFPHLHYWACTTASFSL